MRGLERTAIILAAVVFLSLFFVSIGYAQPYGADVVTVRNSTRYNASEGTVPFINAQAGNVTQLEINATSVTTSWQGFYGNVTGKILLADAAGNNFYDWNMSVPSGEVYASRSNAVTWAGINCTNQTALYSEETTLGQASNDPDSINNTFTLTSHPAFLVGSSNMTTCRSTKAYESTGQMGSSYWQILLNDGTNNVYTTLLDTAGTIGFDDRPWQFQLLVGENGKTGQEATITPYYFYVELQ